MEEIGQKLGRQIAGLISIFNPELVIIGGTLSSTGDYIVQPIKTAIRKYSLNLVNKDATVTISKLKDKAGVVGPACWHGAECSKFKTDAAGIMGLTKSISRMQPSYTIN